MELSISQLTPADLWIMSNNARILTCRNAILGYLSIMDMVKSCFAVNLIIAGLISIQFMALNTFHIT